MLDVFEEEVAEVMLDEVELLWDVELEEEATELLLPSSLVSSSSLSRSVLVNLNEPAAVRETYPQLHRTKKRHLLMLWLLPSPHRDFRGPACSGFGGPPHGDFRGPARQRFQWPSPTATSRA